MMDTFTFNGYSSASYNIYVIGTNDAELPDFDYSARSIEGLTRDMHTSNKRLKNKNVVYHCFCTQNAAENVSRFLGILMSDSIYGKIEDTIHPEYYKVGTYAGGTTPKFYGSNDVSTFDLIFDCDPRKFLKNNGDYTGEDKYSGDTFVDMVVGSNFYVYNEYNKGIYINPIFYLSGISYVSLSWIKDGNSWTTFTVVNINDDTALYYDTETKFAYNASGNSMESHIYSRSWNTPVVPPNPYSLRFKAYALSGAENPVAKVALREYIL